MSPRKTGTAGACDLQLPAGECLIAPYVPSHRDLKCRDARASCQAGQRPCAGADRAPGRGQPPASRSLFRGRRAAGQDLGVLPFGLQIPGDDATGGAALGILQARLRLRSVLAWLVAQPAMRGRPVALISVDGAVPACAALAHRASPLSPHSLVPFDGRPDPVAIVLVRLQAPTLYVVGKCGARLLVRHRAALRKAPASHGVAMLPHETWPAVAPGAFEALASAALSWFARTLPVPAWDAGLASAPARGHGSPLVCPAGDNAPDR